VIIKRAAATISFFMANLLNLCSPQQVAEDFKFNDTTHCSRGQVFLPVAEMGYSVSADRQRQCAPSSPWAGSV